MFRRMLVLLDAGLVGRRVVPWVRRLLIPVHGDVRLLVVLPPGRTVTAGSRTLLYANQGEDAARDAAGVALTAIAAQLRDDGLAVSSEVRFGDPGAVALDVAQARAAGPSTVPSLAVHELPALTSRLTVADAMRRDPVVVPSDATPADAARALRTRGHRAAIVVEGSEVVGVVTATDLLGALVQRLERETPPRLSRLLVAVSLAASTSRRCRSRTALDLALGIARRHRATLTLLHVMRGLSLRVAEGLPAGVDADVQRWRLAEVRAALIRRVLPEDRSMVRVDVRAGDVVEGVLNGAATTGAELIVMGGRPGASLVRETMRRAPCPVLAA